MSTHGYADPEDRGPAKYFHGRTTELGIFQSTLELAQSTKGGTILLFQGPPGAGKSALLHECMERAKAAGWRVADIKGDALHDPGILARKLGVSRPDKIIESDQGGGNVGIKAVLEVSISTEAGHVREYSGDPAETVLQKAGGSHGVVLALDEAQNLEVGVQTREAEKPAISLSLELIHTGKMGVPVVLVAGGLGTSRNVFKSFGISRFRRQRINQLGSLAPQEARAVVSDWLVNDGGAPKDHSYLVRWIDTLAAECHGWPQHLQVYAQQAAGWLKHHSSELTPEVPPVVLEEARKDRQEYYHGRMAGLRKSDRVALASVVREKGKGGTLSWAEMIAAFSPGRTSEQAEQLCDELLHKGIVTENRDGDYIVPIPSMHDWLVDRYSEPVRVRSPKRAASSAYARRSLPNFPDRDTGWER